MDERVKETRRGLRVGLHASIPLNVFWILVVIAAYYFAERIPLVINSPSQFSILVVPFSLGSIAASVISFVPYLSLSSWWRIVPAVGFGVAGYTMSLFFFFESFRTEPSELITRYLDRLDTIGLMIVAFAVITLVCSCVKIRQCETATIDLAKAPAEDKKVYWILKASICDLPIVLSASVIVVLQTTLPNIAHQHFIEVYFEILKSIGVKAIAKPETFLMGAINQKLANANFWIGVTLGVTGIQLIMQQVSALALDIIFWFRRNLV